MAQIAVAQIGAVAQITVARMRDTDWIPMAPVKEAHSRKGQIGVAQCV